MTWLSPNNGTMENTSLQQQIETLGPWFHNLRLPDGTQTAPSHFLGDFPAFKWEKIAPHIPEDLSGKTVLDIGCNAGFYAIELAKRGARVTAIDLDPHYLRQGEWAAEQFGLQDRITFRKMQVYDLSREQEHYDIIWFMGVFYHLRYPLLALDILTERTGSTLVFQTLTMPGMEEMHIGYNYSLNERQDMMEPGWPKMAFIENRLNGDPTNWWAPNHAAIMAILRSCGLKVLKQPDHEVYICIKDPARESVCEGWNRSEYLSAIGRDYEVELMEKVLKH